MSQSLANILVHIVFSTKERRALLLLEKHGIAFDEQYVWD